MLHVGLALSKQSAMLLRQRSVLSIEIRVGELQLQLRHAGCFELDLGHQSGELEFFGISQFLACSRGLGGARLFRNSESSDALLFGAPFGVGGITAVQMGYASLPIQ